MVSAILLLAALALSPVIGGGFGELAASVLQLLVIGAVAVYLLFPRRDGSRVPGAIALAVYAAAVVISMFFTESVYASLAQLLLVAACIGAYFLAASLSSDSRFAAAAVWIVTVSALLVCAMGIGDYATSQGGGAKFWQHLLSTGDHMRLFGPFLNPDFFSGYIVIALPVTLGVYLVTRRASFAMIAGIAFVIETLALMLTGAKLGIIAAVVALFVFIVLSIVTKSLRRSKFVRLIVIGAVLAPLLVVFSAPVRSRIAAAEAGGTQVHSTEFRKVTWSSTLDMVKDRPLLGFGPGTFSLAYPRYAKGGPTAHAHQSYLQLAVESGLIALGAYLGALLVIAYRSLRALIRWSGEGTDRHARTSEDSDAAGDGLCWRDMLPFSGWRLMGCAILAGLVGSGVRNLADSDWYVPGIALTFWILAGVLVAQSGAVTSHTRLSGRARAPLAAVSVIMILLAISFGAAEYVAPCDLQSRGRSPEEMGRAYELASRISPLNPLYYREAARFLARTNPDRSIRKLDIAILLGPTDAQSHFLKGIVELQVNENPAKAIPAFKQALTCSPNSTQALLWLSRSYEAAGRPKAAQAVLRKLISIEESDFEKVRGVPELVDTSFAEAHIYFARDALARKDYRAAADEYQAAVERLERWREKPDILAAQRVAGRLTLDEEREVLGWLRDSYEGLASAYEGMGDRKRAREAADKAESVEEDIEELEMTPGE